MLDKKLEFILKGGRTRRFHTNGNIPPQSVAEHTFFVAMLAGLMWPEDLALVGFILMHDVAEGMVGDVASPVKRASPLLKEALDRAEIAAKLEAGFGAGDMDYETRRRLKMADNMEGLLYCAEEIRRGNKDAIEIYNNYYDYLMLSTFVEDSEMEMFVAIERRLQCQTPIANR